MRDSIDAMDIDLIDEIAEFVFDGAIDTREVHDFIAKSDMSDDIAKMNDASEVHVPGNTGKKKGDLKTKVGLGLNTLAMGAGTHAMIMAGSDDRLSEAGKQAKAAKKITPARILSAPYRAYQNTKMGKWSGKFKKPGAKYAVPLAIGAVGLHGAELVGDSIASQALRNQSKQNVKKNLDHIVNLRRLGQITTEQAIAMADEEVSKGRYSCEECGGETEGTTWCEDCMEVFSTHNTPVHKSSFVPTTPRVIAPEPVSKSYIEYRPATSKEIKDHKLDPSKQWTANKSSHDAEFPGSKPYFEANYNASVGKKVKRFSSYVGGEHVSKSNSIDLGWSGEISKVDTDKRQVFGWCSLTEVDGQPVVDRQGDYIPLEEVEKSAYHYVINSRKGGDMHKRDGEQPLHTSDMIESFVVTPEKLENLGLERDALPHGWWVGFKVNDDKQWEEVKKGDKVHFSIHGKGRRVEKSL